MGKLWLYNLVVVCWILKVIFLKLLAVREFPLCIHIYALLMMLNVQYHDNLYYIALSLKL